MQPQQAMAAGCPAPSPLAALAPAGSQNPGTAISSAVEPSSSGLLCPEISMASDGGAPGPTKSAEQTDSDARPPVASHAIQNLLSTARSAISNCRYRECLKNHAASLGAHATDGCGEFMAAGEEGSVEALFCAACRCHRNFHRRETVQESSHPSLLHLPPPAAPPPAAAHHHQQQHHQYVPSSNIYCDQLYPHATTLLNPRFAGTLGSNISKRSVNLSDWQLPPPPPLADGMPPSRRHRLALPTNTLPAPPAMMMAFNNSHHIHELHHQNEEEEENDDDSNMNLEFGYPIKHKNCGIQYNHPFMSMSPSCLMNSTTTSTTTTTSLNHNYNYNYNPNHNQKRFRTKFTCEQKEKMWHFAEKIGWRFHKDDDDAVRKFCAEVGVKRHVLKVWMHNNKHNLLGTKVKALSPNT